MGSFQKGIREGVHVGGGVLCLCDGSWLLLWLGSRWLWMCYLWLVGSSGILGSALPAGCGRCPAGVGAFGVAGGQLAGVCTQCHFNGICYGVDPAVRRSYLRVIHRWVQDSPPRLVGVAWLVYRFNLAFQHMARCQVEAVEGPGGSSERGGHHEVVLGFNVMNEDRVLLAVSKFLR